MFKWLVKLLKDDKEPKDPIRQELLDKVEAMREGVVPPAPEMKMVTTPCSMFFIKTIAGSVFSSTQFKSIHRNGQHIELKFNDCTYDFKTKHPKEVLGAITKAMADAAAKLVPCTINEAPTPYGMFSYHENPYPGPTGEDLIVDIDSIVKGVKG